MNTAKKSNFLYLIVVLCAVSGSAFLSMLHVNKIDIGIIPNLMLSQLLILVPGLVFYLIYNKTEKFRVYKMIKVPSIILFVVFAELILPLATVANIFSQLFVENEIVAMSDDIMEMPFIVMFFIMGIFGPVCEEFVFRGVIFKGILKYSHRPFASAALSALFFGLIHLNFNQALYAVVLGLIFALIDYLFDSILPSVICHSVINGQNAVLLFIMKNAMNLTGGNMDKEIDFLYGDVHGKLLLLLALVVVMGVAVFTTVFAALLLYGICKIENKSGMLKAFIKKPEKPQKFIYWTGITGVAVCVFVIFLLNPVSKLVEKILF